MWVLVLGVFFNIFLMSHLELIVGTDLSTGNVDRLKQRFERKKIQTDFINVDITDSFLVMKKLSDYNFDTVISSNVLEHINDDYIALTNINSILKKNGRLIIIVPAFDCLYGYLDRVSEHFRRYSIKDIDRKLTNSGFKMIKSFFINIPGILLWKGVNLIFAHKRQVKSHHEDSSQFAFIFRCLKLINPIITAYAKLELKLNLPFGLSIVCVAEKIV